MNYLSLSKKYWLFFFLLCSAQFSYAQLPQADKVYLLVFDMTLFVPRIYTYDPAQPISAGNPSLNSITLPTALNSLGLPALALTVSPVLGSGDPTLTFYTVAGNTYWYYNPVTLSWVNTGHSASGLNLGSSGLSAAGTTEVIYNLEPFSSAIYRYDGTGNDVLVALTQDNLGDIVGDCEGNFYVLQLAASGSGGTSTSYLEKYGPTGAILQTWTVNNPNNYTSPFGLGIVGNTLYFDHFDTDYDTTSIASGTIMGALPIDLNATTSITAQINNGLVADIGTRGRAMLPSVITIAASATAVCSGSPVSFTSTVTAGTDPQYQWFVNGAAVAGATLSTFDYVPGQGDQVRCQLASSTWCVTVMSNVITMQVETPATPQLSFDTKKFCLKGSGSYTPVFTPAGGVFSAAPAGLSLNTTTGEIDLGQSVSGTYIIAYASSPSSLCPPWSLSDTILLAPVPLAEINPVPEGDRCYFDTLQLSTVFTNGYTYLWSPATYFPQSSTSSATVVAHLVNAGQIVLTVTSDKGCISTDSLAVDPIDCCDVLMPSAFSPNGDGLNDIFGPVIRGECPVGGFVLDIYNRYGTRIYSGHDASKGWNGYAGGQQADVGTYMYEIRLLRGVKQTQYYRRGDVTLIR
ncbi:T9SS type B sorting domain-containing protein [Taibaiella koreensis]|uniref:T9SS type B sorting domain-containing protein n=1 Tax=Taibaiella koreensis TaxID=1268548 RepID=UPI0013C332F9|nr:gliding motility-associated C-terminal domain-containing protein [Taibaiella koreensis]